jgi:hypothetical protein
MEKEGDKCRTGEDKNEGEKNGNKWIVMKGR